jgi:endonuclease/exonuclease/phosphatase family metal-dependent hydrolase
MGHALFRESSHLPTLMVGDSNDWRNTLCKGPCHIHGFQHLTTPISRFRSFPAYFAVGSLDKMFWRGDVHLRHARVVRTAMAKRASDHLPLVVDFHLSEPG